MYLTVAEYEASEADAVYRLPNRVTEAFRPFVFSEVGYPVRVKRESELSKFIDVMHERRFENDFVNLLQGISPEELQMLRSLSQTVADFSEYHFGQKRAAPSAILRTFNVLRHLKFLYQDQKPRVFEMGPGCGYLGLQLLLSGSQYWSTDVAQAFYLYQNYLWEFASKGQVVDLALPRFAGKPLRNYEGAPVVHLPWWEFASIRPNTAPQFDIITCNHMLCEMHPDSLRFSVRMMRELLRGAPNEPKAVIFEGWGWDRNHSQGSVAEIFYQNGFVLAHNDIALTIFCPRESMAAGSFCDLPRPSVKEEVVVSNGQAFINATQLNSFQPPEFNSMANAFSATIMQSRQEHRHLQTVTMSEAVHMFRSITGLENPMQSPDDEFWDLIGHPKG